MGGMTGVVGKSDENGGGGPGLGLDLDASWSGQSRSSPAAEDSTLAAGSASSSSDVDNNKGDLEEGNGRQVSPSRFAWSWMGLRPSKRGGGRGGVGGGERAAVGGCSLSPSSARGVPLQQDEDHDRPGPTLLTTAAVTAATGAPAYRRPAPLQPQHRSHLLSGQFLGASDSGVVPSRSSGMGAKEVHGSLANAMSVGTGVGVDVAAASPASMSVVGADCGVSGSVSGGIVGSLSGTHGASVSGVVNALTSRKSSGVHGADTGVSSSSAITGNELSGHAANDRRGRGGGAASPAGFFAATTDAANTIGARSTPDAAASSGAGRLTSYGGSGDATRALGRGTGRRVVVAGAGAGQRQRSGPSSPSSSSSFSLNGFEVIDKEEDAWT